MGKPCPLGFRCHVEGAGITKFGTKFSPDMVLRLASSSVQLINKNLSRRFATATLIWPNVILCDAHSLQGPFLLSDLELLLFHECDAKTAPAAHARFATCTTLATTPQAKLYKELESGYGFGLDYSLIAIEWTSFTVVPSSGGSASKQVKFPRAVVLPKPGYQYGGELLAIGHPSGSGGQSEPT